MEEVAHHVDLGKNILWLGQDAPGGQPKYKLHRIPKDKGREEWSQPAGVQGLSGNAMLSVIVMRGGMP